MLKLTERHKEILEHGAEGACISWQWRWLLNGQPVTRQVNSLIKHGYLSPLYFSGGRAIVCKTEKK